MGLRASMLGYTALGEQSCPKQHDLTYKLVVLWGT